MTYKIIGILLFIIAGIGAAMCLIAGWAYYVYVKNGLQHTEKATDLFTGIKAIAVISAVFFFVGRILYKKWKQVCLSRSLQNHRA
jgi:hypothetical protein